MGLREHFKRYLVDRDEVVKAVDAHTLDTEEGITLDDDITCILEEVPVVNTRASDEYIEQLKWERDLAIDQLNQLGYGLGEEPRPEQKWTPISEGLPNGRTEVIVSCCDDSGDGCFYYTASGWLTTDKEYWIVDNEINSHVIAWMDLPRPYKGDK